MREALPEANVQVLCDLVEPSSEDWQPAIEAYVDRARFNFIVKPDSEADAIELLDKTNSRAKEVQGAECLAKANADRVPQDSIIHELHTEHPIAKAYLVDMYGPVVKVATTQQLRRVPRGVMKDGKRSGGRTMFPFERRELVFGRAARERALAQTIEQLAFAEAEVARLERLSIDLGNVKRNLLNLKQPLFDAQSLSQHATDIDHARRSLSQLDLTEVKELQARLEELQGQLREHGEAIQRAQLAEKLADQRIIEAEGVINRLKDRRKVQFIERDRQIQRLKRLCEANPEKTYTLMSDEVEALAGSTHLDVTSVDRDAHGFRALPEKYLGEVREMLSEYNIHARQEERFPAALPHFHDVTVFDPYYEHVVSLGRAVTKLHADLDGLGLYQNRNEVDKAERSFHDVFTKQFCVEIKTKVDDAIRSLRQLNAELSHLKFGSDRFSIDWSKWEPEFEEYYSFFNAVAELADSPESVDLFGATELTRTPFRTAFEEQLGWTPMIRGRWQS